MLEQPLLEPKRPDELTQSDQLKPPGLFDEALTLSREFRDLLRDHVDVFVTEVRQAAWSVAVVFGAAIAIALLVGSAWTTCMDAASVFLVSVGLAPSAALLLVGLGNLVAAGLAYIVMRRARRRVALPATRRLLTPTGSLDGLR